MRAHARDAFGEEDRVLLQWVANIAAPRIANGLEDRRRRQELARLRVAHRELNERVEELAAELRRRS